MSETRIEIFYVIDGDPALYRITLPMLGSADWCAERMRDTPGFQVRCFAATRDNTPGAITKLRGMETKEQHRLDVESGENSIN
jgi:hypothetical protein